MIEIPKGISVLIPCYNGGASAEKFLTEVKAAVDSSQVLIVDDGSDEKTKTFLANLGLEVLTMPQNVGKGIALRSGLLELKSKGVDQVISMDCDGQHLLSEVSRFWKSTSFNEAGIVVGCRPFKINEMPFARILSNKITTVMVGFKAGCLVYDSQCGYRMYNLKQIVEEDLPLTGAYQWESEVIIKIAKRGCKIKKIDVSAVYEDEVSHIHPIRDIVRFLKMWIKA
jgi:glycosyltransferase involved in cell wall biosynthesis